MKNLQQEETTFLFDLDGTLTLGDEAAPHAAECLAFLNQAGKECFVVTNGAVLSPGQIQNKLQGLGIQMKLENIITAANALGSYLIQNYPMQKVYVTGSGWLKKYLRECGILLSAQNPKAVVVSYDRELRFSEIEECIGLIHSGADYLSTNEDSWIPGNQCPFPHTGAVNGMIEAVLHKKPQIIGKPTPLLFKEILKRNHGNYRKFCMIGDTLSTDIAFAKNCGILSCLVLTGVNTRTDIKNSESLPDIICEHLGDLPEMIERLEL